MERFKFLLIFAIVCSCNKSVKVNQESEKRSFKLDLKLKDINHSNITDTIFTYNKEEVLNKYIQELRDSLNKNKIPDFFVDECLDVSSMGYCIVNSHETISLRTDIVKKMKKKDIEKILLIADKDKLKKKCITDFSKELFNSNKCTYDLLKEELVTLGDERN